MYSTPAMTSYLNLFICLYATFVGLCGENVQVWIFLFVRLWTKDVRAVFIQCIVLYRKWTEYFNMHIAFVFKIIFNK